VIQNPPLLFTSRYTVLGPLVRADRDNGGGNVVVIFADGRHTTAIFRRLRRP